MSCSSQSNRAFSESRSPLESYEYDVNNMGESTVFKKMHDLSRPRDSIGSQGKGVSIKKDISVKPNKSTEPKLPPRYATATPDNADSDSADDFKRQTKSTVKGIAVSLKYDSDGDVRTDPIFRNGRDSLDVAGSERTGGSPKETITPVNLGNYISSEITDANNSNPNQYVFKNILF